MKVFLIKTTILTVVVTLFCLLAIIGGPVKIIGAQVLSYDKPAAADGIEHFARKDLPLWVHFDVDVLDPEIMPVMFPEPGGLTFEETHEFLSLVWASGRVLGMTVACYHPRLDADGGAGARLVALISEVLSGCA